MRWVSHNALAFSAALLLKFPPLGIIISVLSSTFPDAVEFVLRLPHRGIFHSFYIYGIMYVVFLFLPSHPVVDLIRNNSLHVYFLTGVLIGHLSGDFVTITPIGILPGVRGSLKLFQTGSVTEYLFVVAVLLGTVYICWNSPVLKTLEVLSRICFQ
jgi:membrane-bound metal-dependent hydrolase YbcI (DUF457 family)